MAQRVCIAAIGLAFALAGQAAAETATEGMPAGPPPLNYYVPEGSPYGVAAAMYPSPRPTPPLVGWTAITYGPLAPHEFLYDHRHTYVRYNPAGGKTRTHVSWHTARPLPPYVTWGMPVMRMSPVGVGTAPH